MTRRSTQLVCCALALFATGQIAFSQPASEGESAVAETGASAPSTKMMVYVPRSTPVEELTRILAQLYDADSGVRVVASPTNNTLLISAPMVEIERLAKLLPEIDRQPKMVDIEVVIVRLPVGKGGGAESDPETLRKLIAAAEKAGQLSSIDRIRVSTIENQPALVQVGQRKPTTRGATTRAAFGSSRGSAAPFRTVSVAYENVGMIVKVTPAVRGDDTIVMNVDIEMSQLEDGGAKLEAGGEEDEPIPVPQVATSTAQSTLAAKSGRTIVVGGVNSNHNQEGYRLIMLLTGRVK